MILSQNIEIQMLHRLSKTYEKITVYNNKIAFSEFVRRLLNET